jgi:hypothetical protein
MLPLTALIEKIRFHAARVRDEDGAINTVEILIIVGAVIILAGVVFGIVQTMASNEANSLDLG